MSGPWRKISDLSSILHTEVNHFLLEYVAYRLRTRGTSLYLYFKVTSSKVALVSIENAMHRISTSQRGRWMTRYDVSGINLRYLP